MAEVQGPPALKPGNKTSEFAVTALTAGIGMLAAVGVIGAGDVSQLVELGTRIVGGIAAVITVVHYVRERTRLKLGK